MHHLPQASTTSSAYNTMEAGAGDLGISGHSHSPAQDQEYEHDFTGDADPTIIAPPNRLDFRHSLPKHNTHRTVQQLRVGMDCGAVEWHRIRSNARTDGLIVFSLGTKISSFENLAATFTLAVRDTFSHRVDART